MFYSIIASITRESNDGWRTIEQLPTFYLNEDIQGITSAAHAERIVRKMLDRLTVDSIVQHISVEATMVAVKDIS